MKWFRSSLKLVSLGKIIKLDQEWKVLNQINQHDYQATAIDHAEYGTSSYATIQLKCQSQSTGTLAYMRIYMQVPLVDTEFRVASQDERAGQAASMEPTELRALRDLTAKGSGYSPALIGFSIQQQDASGFVPGGALVFVVWEIVDGIRIGDSFGADAFWALKKDERDQIRELLPGGFEEITRCGYALFPGDAKNLVWDSQNKRLRFIGFDDCANCPPVKWEKVFFFTWGVAKPDPDCDLGSTFDWDGDTTGWEW